jgi:hypothetical protein
MRDWQNTMRRFGLPARAIMLGGAASSVFAIVGPIAWRLGEKNALATAALAWALCLAGAMVALLVGYVLREPRHAMAAVLLSMTARMCLPLSIVLAVRYHGGPLAEGGLLYYVLVFYPITLAAEIFLTLPETLPLGNSPSDAVV